MPKAPFNNKNKVKAKGKMNAKINIADHINTVFGNFDLFIKKKKNIY